MAKRSLFGFLKRAGLGKESVLLTELTYEDSKDKSKTKVDDLSAIKIQKGKYVSPLLRITPKTAPQIPVIGVGGAGVRIVSTIAERLSKYKIKPNLMGIETSKPELDQHKKISHTYLIPDSNTGTGKQYRVGASKALAVRDELKGEIESYLESLEFELQHEIVFLILGAGGTGVGVGLEVAKILLDIGKRPVPFLVLPSEEENTRIQFTAAVALYSLSYGPADTCLKLTTICIDNDYFVDENTNNSYGTLIPAINERIGATIGDLMLSAELVSDGYSADMNEFLEVFRQIKGIGVMTYMHSGSDYDKVRPFFNDKQSVSHSMDVNVFSSTRSFLFIQANRRQITAKDYRNLISDFNNSDIFPKLIEIDDDNINFEVRGIFTGITIPNKIEDLMRDAQDVRVNILNVEVEKRKEGRRNPKIERLRDDEEIEVKTGEELAKDSMIEFAKKAREEGGI